MLRVTDQSTVETFAAAMDHMPTRLRSWAACDLHIGDPLWSGAFPPGDDEDMDDGRSYRRVAHFLAPFHQEHMSRDRREPTVVLPRPGHDDWWTCWHELGHVIHYRLGEHLGLPDDPWRWPTLTAPSRSAYYRRNLWEGFAGAWESYALRWSPDRYVDTVSHVWPDPEINAFFDALPARP